MEAADTRLSCWLCGWESWPGTGTRGGEGAGGGRRALAWPALPSRGPKRGRPTGLCGVARPWPVCSAGPQVLGLPGRAAASPTALSCHLFAKSDDWRFMGLF